ncbi:MAG: putative lipid II flippase FtsW [Clostridia bacterium]
MRVMSGLNKKDTSIKKNMDIGMLITIIILLCAGLIMVASASSYFALNTYSNSNFFLTRQLIFAVGGIIAMLIISKMDYHIYKKWSYLGFAVAILLLIAVLTPLGVKVNGAKRWLGFGTVFRFQPSEIMKIVIVLALSTYLSNNFKKLSKLKGYYVPIAMIGVVVLVMFLQKHMSGALIIAFGAASVILCSGIKIKPKYIIILSIIGALAVSAFIVAEPFRVKRLLSFANPEEDIRGGNWQAAQSLYAIGSGGLFGRGLGQSRQKYLWLPEAQNDFIFSVLGEEFGLLGTVTVLGLFTFFIYRGYKIAIGCNDLYGSLIATGITSVFALQILVNIAVVTCTMPVTGMPLPFFSYGGTALFINLCSMGIVLSISRNCKN